MPCYRHQVRFQSTRIVWTNPGTYAGSIRDIERRQVRRLTIETCAKRSLALDPIRIRREPRLNALQALDRCHIGVLDPIYS